MLIKNPIIMQNFNQIIQKNTKGNLSYKTWLDSWIKDDMLIIIIIIIWICKFYQEVSNPNT